jgi:N-acetylneuraminic acid mutarotase
VLATLACIRRPLATAPLLLALLCLGCGSSKPPASSGTPSHRAHPAAHAPAGAANSTAGTLTYRPLFTLPAAVQDPAGAPLGADRFVLLGGITPSVTSTAAITLANVHGPEAAASLPGPQHDAQAAALAGAVYVFGGGEFRQYDHILRFDPGSRAVSQAGTLPTAESDVAVTALDGTAYVVGGFDGSKALDTIVAWSPGSQARVVAHLPVAMRYAAVAAVSGSVLIIGGSTPAGATAAIYRYQPASGNVQQIGRLPQPITHAGAAVLGSSLYLVGGREDSTTSQTSGIWSIDPSTGKVAAAGRLPEPLSDAGVVGLGGGIVVAGGHSPGGTQAAVGELALTG